VYHLVERANEAGGPDNITAIVVRVNEVGAELPNGRKPVYVGGREEGGDTATLGLLPGSAVSYAARNGEGRSPSAPLHLSSEPLAASESTAPPLVIPAEPHGKEAASFIQR